MNVDLCKKDLCKKDYLTGEYTLKELAEKYKVGFSTLKKYSSEEDWVGQRAAFLKGVHEEARQEFINKEIGAIEDCLTAEYRIARKLSSLLEKAANEQCEVETLNADGEVVCKVDITAVNLVARTLKQVEEIKRSIVGVTSIQEDRVYDLNKERLDIERKRLERDSDEDDEGCGVLILPAVEIGDSDE